MHWQFLSIISRDDDSIVTGNFRYPILNGHKLGPGFAVHFTRSGDMLFRLLYYAFYKLSENLICSFSVKSPFLLDSSNIHGDLLVNVAEFFCGTLIFPATIKTHSWWDVFVLSVNIILRQSSERLITSRDSALNR